MFGFLKNLGMVWTFQQNIGKTRGNKTICTEQNLTLCSVEHCTLNYPSSCLKSHVITMIRLSNKNDQPIYR